MNDQTSFYFIKSQKCTVLMNQLFHSLEIPELRHDYASTHQNRFKYHSGDFALVFVEHPTQRLDVIERHYANTISNRLRNAGTRCAPRIICWAKFFGRPKNRNCNRVVMSVV